MCFFNLLQFPGVFQFPLFLPFPLSVVCEINIRHLSQARITFYSNHSDHNHTSPCSHGMCVTAAGEGNVHLFHVFELLEVDGFLSLL